MFKVNLSVRCCQGHEGGDLVSDGSQACEGCVRPSYSSCCYASFLLKRSFRSRVGAVTWGHLRERTLNE